MAASVNGRSVLIGYEQSTSTWGTAVAPGATDLILAESLSPLGAIATMVADPCAGYNWPEHYDATQLTQAPELSIPVRIDGRFWSLVAQCMGLDSKSGAEDPYTHLLTLVDNIDGSDMFGTLAAEVGGAYMFEWASVKPTGFTFSGPDGNGYINLAVRTITDVCNLGADGTVVAGDFDALTHNAIDSAQPPIFSFGQAEFKLNTYAAAAVSASTAIPVKSFNFTFNRNFSPNFSSRGSYATHWQTAEPVEDGIPEALLSVELQDFGDLTYFEAHQDEAHYKAQLSFLYDATHSVIFEFPNLGFNPTDASISGVGRIPRTLNLVPLEAASGGPTGMAFTTWRCTITNEYATAYE